MDFELRSIIHYRSEIWTQNPIHRWIGYRYPWVPVGRAEVYNQLLDIL